MNNVVDHIVFGAASLDQGSVAVEDLLGVEVPIGGKHTAMSTHNRVAQAGRGAFLEIIAIDPDGPPVGRPRWFGLDDPATKLRLAARPSALGWVVGTDDLDGVVRRSPVDLGEVLQMSRGGRSWRLTVPQDGGLPEGGLVPAFIEWSPGPHPSAGMPDLGLELKAIRLSHPEPERLRRLLGTLQVDHLAEIVEGNRGIGFTLDGPNGLGSLD